MGRKVSSRRRRTKVLFLSFPFVYRSSRDFQVVSFPCIVLSTQLNYCFDIIILRKDLPTIAFLTRFGHEGGYLREYQSNSWLGSNMVHASLGHGCLQLETFRTYSTLSRLEPRVRVAVVIGHQTIFFYLVSNTTKMLILGLCDIRRPQAGFTDFDKANRIPEILFFGGEIYKRSPSLSASPPPL